MTQKDPVPPPTTSAAPAEVEPEPARLLPGRLKLDELLADVLERVQELQGQRQRLRILLDDVVGIASRLSLDETLHRIVEAGRQLVDARYAALGVLGEHGGLQEFITSGVEESVATEIGHLPEGLGILGLLIDQPKPLRLEDLNVHPAAHGFPPGHPPMRSFLGVPITVRRKVFGYLYLSEKIDWPEFDEDDEQLVVALAGAAGIAIDNARLYEQSALRQRWLRAGAAASHTILATADDPATTDALGPSVIVDTAREVSSDDLVAVWMLVDGGAGSASSGSLLCRAVAGPGSEIMRGAVLSPGSSVVQQVIAADKPRLVPDLDAENSSWRPPQGLPPLGSALFLPLTAESGPLGALVLARSPRRPRHGPEEIDMARGFADQAALALALVASQQDRRRLAVFADRDRIGRDLHDQVIQQLFASGLTLQGLTSTLPAESAAKVDQVVQNLDDTIGDLRRAIFALRVPPDGDHNLRTRLVEVVTQTVAGGSLHPHLRLDGPLDASVSAELADHVVAVVREALSNAIRHAEATSVDVTVTLRRGLLTAEVTDDGRGLAPVRLRESGLKNLRSRAMAHGGTFRAETGPDGRGTTVVWQVPTA
jgi:two-component system, NarL family, sensor histidine kinase DevS